MLKHILDTKGLDIEEIYRIIEKAKEFKEFISRKEVPSQIKIHKRVANLFFEPSTRTKTSFEIAEKMLGMETVSIHKDASSITKGESLYDTIKTLISMDIDIIVIRHKYAGTPHFIARHFDIPVINAGDGYNAHPTQAILDAFTIIEHFGRIEGLNILIVGDIMHSRVARSNMFLFKKLGANVTLCGPATLIPRDIETFGINVSYNFIEELEKADVVNMLRMQFERQTEKYIPNLTEYRKLFSLTRDKVKHIKKTAMLIHPGPVNRGIEIDDDVLDLNFSYVSEQVKNGIAIRMAILYFMGKER